MAGNANSGRKLDKWWSEALRVEAMADDQKKLRQLAKVVWAQALSGDATAYQEIANRLDGRPQQTIEAHTVTEFVFAEVPKTETTDEWAKSLAAVAGVSSQARKQH